MTSVKVRILERTENRIRFVLSGLTPALANALRRTMIADVPTMAIDEVVVLENTSVLPDEILAHRLALIPLKVDLESYRDVLLVGEEPKQQVRLILDVEAATAPITVYSGHLKSEDPHVVPAYPNIPIVKLERGQRVTLEAFARFGSGKEHAKWQPVSACAYKFMPILGIDEDKCTGCGRCAEECPKGVLEVSGGKVVVKDVLKCTTCRACELACPVGAIRVSWDDTTFIFNVESVGSIPPEEIFKKALDIMIRKAEIFKEMVAKLEGGEVEEDWAD